MASPEVIDSSGALDAGVQGEPSAPQGWAKKLTPVKAGTAKRNDVFYVAPDGEEIKNKRQLDKYLKSHPGGPSSAEFDWSTGEMPRRSARLSTKVGRLSSDSADAEPVTKRSRRSSDDTRNARSPASSTIPSKKGRKSKASAAIAGQEESMQEAGKEQDEAATEVASGAIKAETPAEEAKQGGDDSEAKTSPTGDESKEAIINVESAGQSTDQLAFPEEAGSAPVKVNAEEQVLTTEGIIPADTVMIETNAVIEEDKVGKTVLEAGETGAEDPLKLMEVDALEEVMKSAGETSIQEEKLVVEETIGAPNSQSLAGKEVDTPVVDFATKDEGPLKPKDHVESQGIHALIEEPVLCGLTKTDPPTEPPVPTAERVGVSS